MENKFECSSPTVIIIVTIIFIAAAAIIIIQTALQKTSLGKPGVFTKIFQKEFKELVGRNFLLPVNSLILYMLYFHFSFAQFFSPL